LALGFLNHQQLVPEKWWVEVPDPFVMVSGVTRLNVGVSKNRGIPKWTVYNGKPY